MNSPFLTLINKNLKVFFRSKISAISIILIPFLIILFAGVAFNSNDLSNVQIGVYSESENLIKQNILNEFEKNNFTTKKYETSEGCINSVKLSKSQLCVFFEENDKIIFHIDDSRINLADLLINNVQSSTSKESQNMGGILVQNLIDTLEKTKETLPEKEKNLENSINIAQKSKGFITGLSISDTETDNIEKSLEDAKKTVNNTNTEKKINEALTTIAKLKEDNDLLREEINNAKSSQDDLIKELEKNKQEINELINTLNKDEVKTAQKIISPLDINIESISSSSKKRNHLIPILISLIALFGATLISSTFVMKAKKSKAYFRNFITPVKEITFILATYITCLIILLFQFTLVFAGIYFLLKINIFIIPLELIATLLISLTVFIFLGMLIGYLFRSEETIIFASMIVSALLMFFSNAIIPLENISSNLMKFAKMNPVIISHSLFKKIILFQIRFTDLKEDFLIMGIFAISFLALTTLLRHLSRRRL